MDVLKDRNARHILNDLPFAGYLISRELPVSIDGRAELYGENFEMAYYRALQLQDVNLFLDILKTYEIDTVLLTPSTPAAVCLIISTVGSGFTQTRPPCCIFAPPIDAEAIPLERLNATGSTITARQVREEKFLTKLCKHD